MLKLSKKGSYAVKAMIYIAQSEKELLHVSDIAEAEEISISLLRRIISDLEKSGLIKTVKGRYGGVQVGTPIHKVSIYHILDAVGEELGITECTKGVNCDKNSFCSTTDVFNSLQTGFNSLLKMYTLEKILKNK
ncbi:MAG: Rrf2 family transcriptional regulator [Candidatus Gracilibacteria bacterium]|nr:Rrf2 family transcriptional regulator [Candidatus Gracilibacteria bacterium]